MNLIQMTIISTTVGKNSSEESIPHSQQVWNAVLECNLKNNRMISLFPRQIISYHSHPSLAPTTNAEEAEVEWFHDDLQDLLELTPEQISFSS